MSCYELGALRWQRHVALDAWPAHGGAPEPAEVPALYEEECASGPSAEEAASALAPDEAGATLARGLQALPTEPWVPGTRWVYRVERRPAAGRVDEASALDFHLVRTVTAVESEADGALRVTLEERGGHFDQRVRTLTYRLAQGCLEAGDGAPLGGCLGDGDRVLQWRVGERVVTVRELRAAKGAGRVLYAPGVGPVLFESRDEAGRATRQALVGYSLARAPRGADSRSGGAHALEPVECDWTRSARIGHERFEIPLSGRHGYGRLVGSAAMGRASVLFEAADDALADLAQTHSHVNLTRIKTWLAGDHQAEYALLQLESSARLRFVLLRLQHGEVWEERLSFARPDNGSLSALMMSRPDGCTVRFVARQGAVSRVLELEPTARGLRRAASSSLEPL